MYSQPAKLVEGRRRIARAPFGIEAGAVQDGDPGADVPE